MVSPLQHEVEVVELVGLSQGEHRACGTTIEVLVQSGHSG